MIKLIVLHALLSGALSQYAINTGLKPDVTFGDENDRFDLTSIIDEQNRFYGVDNMDYRRADNIKREQLMDAIRDTLASGKVVGTKFGYQDTMDHGGGTAEDFEINLKKFEKEAEEYKRRLQTVVDDLHDGQENGRRSNGPDLENEVLLHHAVPVEMNVKGYIQLPLVE